MEGAGGGRGAHTPAASGFQAGARGVGRARSAACWLPRASRRAPSLPRSPSSPRGPAPARPPRTHGCPRPPRPSPTLVCQLALQKLVTKMLNSWKLVYPQGANEVERTGGEKESNLSRAMLIR